METYRNIKISAYSYTLSEDRIAKYPLPERDQSRLLIWEKGNIDEDVFSLMPEYLPNRSLLVFNNTRVIHARLLFRKETGSQIEVFCLEPETPSDHQLAFQQTGQVVWKCMVGNAKKWKEGPLVRMLDIDGTPVSLSATKTARDENSFTVKFEWNGGFSFASVIEHAGTLPIPPYLNRDTEDSDEETYQTVYARIYGSVAAPTAGLHFTPEVLKSLSDKDIATREITLHVGAGTFRPVQSEVVGGHDMHREKVIFPKTLIYELIENPRKVIAVGTTSVRSLESLYWLGSQLEEENKLPEIPEVTQWEPYRNHSLISTEKALRNLLNYLDHSKQQTLQFSTQIIIVPGYDFKLIDGMITNFHQPQSTLLLLIAAFLGDDWKKVYTYALDNGFRFLSYGDSNLYMK